MDAKQSRLKDDGANYVAWAVRIGTSLKEAEVWLHVCPVGGVDGGTVRPVLGNHGVNAAGVARWDQADAKASKVIQKGLTDEGIIKVSTHEFARQAWNHLKQLYSRTGNFENRVARGALSKLRIKWTQDVNTIVSEAMQLFAVFARPPNAAPLTDGEKIGYLIEPLRVVGGRWRTVADNVEGELGYSERQYDAQVNHALANGLAAPVHVTMTCQWDDFKARLEREQRDRDAGTGAWTASSIKNATGTTYQGNPKQHRAYAAMIDGGMTHDEAANSANDMKGNGNNNGGNRGGRGGGRGGGAAGGGGARRIPKGPCWNCGEIGHASFDCPNERYCQKCKNNSHSNKECKAVDRDNGKDANSAGAGGSSSGGGDRAASTRSHRKANDFEDDDRLDVDDESMADFFDKMKFSAKEKAAVAKFQEFQDTQSASGSRGKNPKHREHLVLIASGDPPWTIVQGNGKRQRQARHAATATRPWMMDSGCSKHMTPHRRELTPPSPNRRGPLGGRPTSIKIGESDGYREVKAHPGVRIANNDVINVEGIGNGKIGKLELKGALHVPALGENLASITGLSDDGLRVTFEPNRGEAYVTRPRNDKERRAKPPGEMLAKGVHDGQVWMLRDMTNEMGFIVKNGNIAFSATLDLAHARYGHIGLERLKRACLQQLRRKHNPGVMLDIKRRDVLKATLSFCEMCELANSRRQRMNRKSRGHTHTRATTANYRLHLDACIVNVIARTGAVIFVTTVECKSRYGYYAGLAKRSDVYEMFLQLEAKIERQVDGPISKTLESRGWPNDGVSGQQLIYGVHDSRDDVTRANDGGARVV